MAGMVPKLEVLRRWMGGFARCHGWRGGAVSCTGFHVLGRLVLGEQAVTILKVIIGQCVHRVGISRVGIGRRRVIGCCQVDFKALCPFKAGVFGFLVFWNVVGF